VKLIPHDTKDYAYTVNFFQVGRGGTLKMRLATGEVRTVLVASGACVSLPVKRIYRSGTTASDFQTDMLPDSDYATHSAVVPFAGRFDEPTLPPPPPPPPPPGSQDFDTAGTFGFTPDPGVTSVLVKLRGAGAGSQDGGLGGGTGGSGGGGYSESVVSVTPGVACTVVVGAGSARNSGLGGGNTRFVRDDGYTVQAGGGGPPIQDGSLAYTVGGHGGNGFDADEGGSSDGSGGYINADVHHQGGDGADANGNTGGGGGAGAGATADGADSTGPNGGVGAGGGGNGGGAAIGGTTFPPSAPGGGAGGGGQLGNSTVGAAGKATVSWPP
jgi:hypothetical protein